MINGWEVLDFNDVFEDITKYFTKIPTNNYKSNGRHAIIDQSQQFIAGYTDIDLPEHEIESPFIIFGDHTRVFKFIDFECFIGADGVKVLRNKIIGDTKYYFHFLTNLEIENNGYSRHFKFLKRQKILIPPISEQKRIAAILDKADEIRRKREQAITKLEQLAQSIFVEMFGDPALNTKSLPLISLGELGTWRSGGTPARSNKDYFIGDINWFSSGELEQMYISQSKEKISQYALENTSASLIKKGALLLGMYDTAALKSSIANVDCSCNQAIAFSEITNPSIKTIYVYLAIQYGKEHFKRLQRGVRQQNLNLEIIRQIQIPLPPINKQLEYIHIFEKIQLIKDAESKCLLNHNALFASLQQQAFSGNL
jgi:type I restriction enzyme S subunit